MFSFELQNFLFVTPREEVGCINNVTFFMQNSLFVSFFLVKKCCINKKWLSLGREFIVNPKGWRFKWWDFFSQPVESNLILNYPKIVRYLKWMKYIRMSRQKDNIGIQPVSSTIRFLTAYFSCQFPQLSLSELPKISKQSALAVKQYLRDNQHQSPGRPGFALAWAWRWIN